MTSAPLRGSTTSAASSRLPMIPPSCSQKTSAFWSRDSIEFCLRTLFQISVISRFYFYFDCFDVVWVVVIVFLDQVVGRHTGTRRGCVNLTIQRKPTSAAMNVSLRDFCPPAVLTVTSHAEELVGLKFKKIRRRTTSDVKERLSLSCAR